VTDLGRWLDDWAELVGSVEPATRVGRDLLARWGEPHRRYHNQDHLAAVLRYLEQLSRDGRRGRAVRLAAWYHDAIYRPDRNDNEAQSAELAQLNLSSLGVDRATTAEVVRLVRLTATHEPAAGDGHGAMLCDADLAVLAGRGAEYRRYAHGIRLEYGHLEEGAWRAGRIEVLRNLLARPSLFHTELGRARWEARARDNIKAELAELTDGASKAADADRPSGA
jgi:predicted metal-dependent HD superfamily phosphohydrolase